MKRLLLVPIGILLGLALLEAALQVAAPIVQARAGNELPAAIAASRARGSLRVVCIGDSNTYGVRVPRDQTWPAQLERRWNESGREPRLEVVNLGFPGTNSSRVVRDLPRLLELLQPDVTIVMTGVNDFWTVPFPVEDDDGGLLEWVQRHSRVYRLALLLRRGRTGEELEIAKDPETTPEGGGHTLRIGDEEFAMEFRKGNAGLRGDAESLRRNLETITRQARRGGTRLVFMTYPAREKSFYPLANRAIREVAARTGTPLVDLTAVFEPLCPEIRCPEYLLGDDHHPNATGYGVVAETVSAHFAGAPH